MKSSVTLPVTEVFFEHEMTFSYEGRGRPLPFFCTHVSDCLFLHVYCLRINACHIQSHYFVEAMNVVLGSIDVIQGNLVSGWVYSPSESVLPMLFSDGEPATLVGANVPRPDVAEALGITLKTGFTFRAPCVKKDSILTLYAVTPQRIVNVVSHRPHLPVVEQRFLVQAQIAASICKQPNAVAITCWDGAHNPLGRAKVLYDVLSCHRPCVVFCYLHREFGGTIWLPLLNSNLPIVTIPWEHRNFCHSLLRRSGICFNTVWICKPRLPSFRLASVISGPQTRLVLDIDDDEEAFILSQREPTEYNLPAWGLAQKIMASVSSRTVVSPPLQKHFGGVIVRHVRTPHPCDRHREGNAPRKIAFLGTVHEHKGLLPLAKALRQLSSTSGIDIEFHVRGDFPSTEYRQSLEAENVFVNGMSALCELPDALKNMDAVITSFPLSGEQEKRIARAQVSAKIADALSVGLPVLTPDSPSIADIRSVPGVYPFTSENFESQVLAALNHQGTIVLPADFTPQGAYEAFAKVEKKACPAKTLQTLLPVIDKRASIPTLLLLWKQYDAGLYGRRVDQLARSYARAYPDKRVVVLELLNEAVLRQDSLSQNYTDEIALRNAMLEKKRFGWKQDGALYQTLFYEDPVDLRRSLLFFLEALDLMPWNTSIVLFPIIQDYRHIEDLLQTYPSLVDVVDNQLAWADSDERRCFVNEQYFRLMRTHKTVVFNSEQNKDYFANNGLLSKDNTVHVIPNWYEFPDNMTVHWQAQAGEILNIFYSGNLNDRIDWHLLHELARQYDVCLHVAGTAQRAMTELLSLLKEEHAVYHGVTSEKDTLKLLQGMDAAIVPHLFDAISRYMDPMKLQMYAAVGLPVLCPEFLAVPTPFAYRDTASCLTQLRKLHWQKEKNQTSTNTLCSLKTCTPYLDVISTLHNAESPTPIGGHEMKNLG